MIPDAMALFREVADRSPAEREEYYLRECIPTALRAEVESLLRFDEETAGDIRGRVAAAVNVVLAVEGGGLGGGLAEEPDDPAPALPGKRVGPWRIVRELGRGGMAVVYLAERADGAYDQRVALKLLRAGDDAADLVRRFQRERQILASLKHPHIAGLVDGGLTEDGQPWFSMEHVEGERIDRFCDRHRLTVEQRLRLFIQVARVVRAAHRALVVHRDLKPSNILVTEEGEPRLLDFGIAKPLDPQGDDAAVTRTVLMLTPDYASPEQVRGVPVTPASDVYQLGLLLFELLTGERAQRVDGRSAAQLERVVLEQSVAPPSIVAGTGDAAATRAEARQTTPSGLARLLRGDLDAIVLQALRKEPERRYASVADLIDDLERQFAGRPIQARPDSWHYRTDRFLTRHHRAISGGVVGAALLAALSVGMLAVTRLESRRANVDSERAEALQLLRLGQEAMRRVTCDSEALALFERAIQKAPSLIAARVDRGWASYSQVTLCGRGYAYTRQALEDARAVQALDPRYADAWLLEASILTEVGRAEEAFERIRSGSRWQPDAAELHFGAAYAATYAGYLDLAAAELDRALAIEPGYLERAGWTPNAYLYRGELDKFLSLLPPEESAYNQFYRAWSKVLRGEPGKAVELLERVRDADPVDVFARLDRALVAVLSNEAALGGDVVRELARQRLEHRAGDGELTLKQAQVLALAGLRTEAASQLRLAVEQGFFCPTCIESDRVLSQLAAEPDYAAALEAARRRHASFGRRFSLSPTAGRSPS
jgi:serine/threonine protein kinase